MEFILQNRREAGKLLASKLTEYIDTPDGLVLALPRGGVPVAFEIAQKLNLPLDVCLVRKLGVPYRSELAMGAIGTGGIMVVNHAVVESLQIADETIQEIARSEQRELERRELLYRGDRPYPQIQDRTIVLVDDGVATGSTLQAAIATLKQHHPKAIVVAVPIASEEAFVSLNSEVDRFVYLAKPYPLHSISLWYDDFAQTTDEEVCALLDSHLMSIVNEC
jgi:putative phosphoribosyl transferase